MTTVSKPQQSSDMVGRLLLRAEAARFEGSDPRDYTEAADAIASCVVTLKKARRLAHALEADGPTTREIDTLLAKIGGEQ